MTIKWHLLTVLIAILLAGCGPTPGAAPEETALPPTSVPVETGTASASPTMAPETPLPAATATPDARATAEATEPASDESEVTMTPTSDQLGSDLPQVRFAVNDLAERLGVAPESIEVIEATAVTWPDSSMGCPQPGMAYTQVQQDGLFIRLQVDGQVYAYHSGGTRQPFLCEQGVEAEPGGEKLTPIPLDELLTRQAPED